MFKTEEGIIKGPVVSRSPAKQLGTGSKMKVRTNKQTEKKIRQTKSKFAACSSSAEILQSGFPALTWISRKSGGGLFSKRSFRGSHRPAPRCPASPRPAPPRFSAEAPRAAAACAGPGFVLKPEKGSARKASFQPINLEREGEEGWRYVLLE